MRIPRFLALVAPLAVTTLNWNALSASAQETLAGVGAASAMGAGLGAAGATMPRNIPGAAGSSAGMSGEGMDMAGMDGASPMMPGGTMGGTGTGKLSTPLPPLAVQPGSGRALLGQLLSAPTVRPIPENKRRTARQQAAYSRRITRMTAAQRKKLVMAKYKIGPVNWLASYLPADRYKFSKAWKYVSTENDHYYYSPRGMAGHRFNANRVIGFRTWQDAMLAGYRPDPRTKPEPGNQLAFFASMTRDEPLLTTIEYAYSGQISPASLNATYNYIRDVKAVIDSHPQVKKYQRETINAILTAALNGDPSSIPTVFGQSAAPPASAIGAGGLATLGAAPGGAFGDSGARGGAVPSMPSMPSQPSGSSGGLGRPSLGSPSSAPTQRLG